MSPTPDNDTLLKHANSRIEELEIRTAFLEETIDSLNQHLSDLSQEFNLAKQAMRHLHQRLEQVQQDNPVVKDFSEETPPPHY